MRVQEAKAKGRHSNDANNVLHVICHVYALIDTKKKIIT